MAISTANVYLFPPNGLPSSLNVYGRTYNSPTGAAIPFPYFDAAIAQGNGWTPYSPTGASGGGSGIVTEPTSSSPPAVGLTTPGFSIPLASQTVASGGTHNILPMPTTGIVSGKVLSTIVYSGGTFSVCVDFYWATGTPLTIANYGLNYQFISSSGGIITGATPFSLIGGFLTVATLGGPFTSQAGASQQATFLGIYDKVS